MAYFVIKSYQDNSILAEGEFPSLITCIEDCITNNVTLRYADLGYCNLMNGNFDGADFSHICFKGSNLTGVNLSEANLDFARFHHADLFNACFAYSTIKNADFSNANFGATDITQTELDYTLFSNLSCFDLNFFAAKSMNHCQYRASEGVLCKMTKHPIVIKGALNTPIIILDQVIKIGSELFPLEFLNQFWGMIDSKILQRKGEY